MLLGLSVYLLKTQVLMNLAQTISVVYVTVLPGLPHISDMWPYLAQKMFQPQVTKPHPLKHHTCLSFMAQFTLLLFPEGDREKARCKFLTNDL